MTPEQLNNFKNDLKKAQKITLLLDTLPEHDTQACLDAAKSVYDEGLPPGKTNLIFIDALAEECADKFVLLDVLLKELGQDLEQFNKIQSGVMAAKGLLSGGYNVAGLLTGGATGGFDLLMEKPLDYMIDKLVDIATDKVVDNGVDYATEQAKDLSSKLSDYRLNLSSTSKQNFIAKTLSKFDSDLSLGEIFNLTETLLLNCSVAEKGNEKSQIFYGKLLVIQDPASLDTITLALINHLLAICKDQSDLPFNLSFLYLRTQPDPQEGEAAGMLTNQRTFALRYGMYETPDADYPNRLITPDLFVGRQQELKILHDQATAFYETHAPAKDFTQVVLGEPGMGKTRLVEKHHQQFRKHLAETQEKELAKQEIFTVKLTLYCDNQLSADSGLSSLIGSLEKEIDRMAAAYKEHATLFQKQFSKIKDLLLNKPEELIPLYKDFQSIKKGLQNWKKGTADSIQQKSVQSLELLGQERGNQKEREFERLDHTISHLLHLINQLKLPKRLELFIDDLQWIDEISAEYILRLQGRLDFQVRTLATARISDSESAIKSWSEQPEGCKHRLELIQKLGYQGENQWDPVGSLRVNPLDNEQVTQLINDAIVDTNHSLSNTLAQEVCTFLDPDQKGSLSTLFTVETLNLLSDQNLYTDSSRVKPVFNFEEGKVQFVERTPEELKCDLHQIFSRLAEKYRESFDIELGGFNLSSYAVMEERLRLIEQHLGKLYAHLLTFSHLSRTPFEPKLIEQFICALAEAEELDPSFKNEMAKACGMIENERLETLEEVYLLVDELERPKRHLMYGHRHRLVEIFVGAAFKRMITSYVPEKSNLEPKRLEYLVRKVFNKVITKYLEDHHVLEKNESNLTKEEGSRKLTLLNARMLNLKDLYSVNPILWAEDYAVSLNRFSESFISIDPSIEVVNYALKVYDLCKTHNSLNADIWFVILTEALNRIAEFYIMINSFNKAVGPCEHVVSRIFSLYERNPEDWIEQLVESTSMLAICYIATKDTKKAVGFCEQMIETVTPLYKECPERWSELYAKCLIPLALSYREDNQVEKSIAVYKEAVVCLVLLYNSDHDRWAEDLSTTLSTLAYTYLHVKQYEQAAEFYEESLRLRDGLYHEKIGSAANDYIKAKTMNNIASVYLKINRRSDAINILEEGCGLLSLHYNSNPLGFSELYIASLNNLAHLYQESNKPLDSLRLYEQAFNILDPHFKAFPDYWSNDYSSCLGNLAILYQKNKSIGQSIRLYERYLNILKPLYENSLERWIEDYTTCLNNLAFFSEESGLTDNAVQLFEESLQIIEALYKENPKRWESDYQIALQNLVSSYNKVKHTGNFALLMKAFLLSKSNREQRSKSKFTSKLQQEELSMQSPMKKFAIEGSAELMKLVEETDSILCDALETIENAKTEYLLPREVYDQLIKAVHDMRLMLVTYKDFVRPMTNAQYQELCKNYDMRAIQSQLDASIRQLRKDHAPSLYEGVIETIEHYKGLESQKHTE